MRVVKSLQASLLTKTFQYQQRQFMVASTLWGFHLDSGTAALEQAMWSVIGDSLGPTAVLDEAMNKDSAEFLVFGDAIAPVGKAVARLDVEVEFNGLSKRLNVYGDRFWQGAGVLQSASAPQPFARMAIDYANAFGGANHEFNPMGKGLNTANQAELEWLPNIEAPDEPLISSDSRPEPAGFGPLSTDWPVRRLAFGSIDDDYLQNDMPGLARDIDWRYFNVAPVDQRFNSYLLGDEDFRICNMHDTMPVIAGRLPGVIGRCVIEQRAVDESLTIKEIPLKLDTVLFFPNDNLGIVLHRGTVEVSHPQGSDVTKLLVAHQGLTEPSKSLAYYAAELNARTDREQALKYMLNSTPLIPLNTLCGFKQIQQGIVTNSPFAANMSAYADGRANDASQRADEAIASQITELRAQGHDEQADDLLQRTTQVHTPPEPGAEAQATMAIVDQILPGAASGGLTAQNIDLATLDLSKLDDLKEHLGKQTEQKKAEALDKVRSSVEQMKAQAAEQDNDGSMNDAIKQLEVMLEPIALLPPLPRPDVQARLKQLKSNIATAQDSARELRAEVDAAAIPLTADQLARLQQLDESLDLSKVEQQLSDAHQLIDDGYLKAAHFMPRSRSPHAGEEPDKIIRLLASYRRQLAIDDRDFAFCELRDQTLEDLALAFGYFEYAVLQDVTFERCDLGRTNFAHSVLGGVRFNATALNKANFGAAILSDCTFEDIAIDEITFAKSELIRCTFINCQFGDRMDMLLETQLKACRFVNCRMAELNFIELTFEACLFESCDLTKSQFIKAELLDCSFFGSNLTAVNFIKAEMIGAHFENAVLQNTRFVGGCHLLDADFSGASINDANLRDCDLRRANFTAADISRTDFGNSKLSNANFSRCTGHQAQFLDADLQASSFRQADMMEANMMQADLRACGLQDANLYSVSFFKATLGSTDFSGANLENTILKDWRPIFD